MSAAAAAADDSPCSSRLLSCYYRRPLQLRSSRFSRLDNSPSSSPLASRLDDSIKAAQSYVQRLKSKQQQQQQQQSPSSRWSPSPSASPSPSPVPSTPAPHSLSRLFISALRDERKAREELEAEIKELRIRLVQSESSAASSSSRHHHDHQHQHQHQHHYRSTVSADEKSSSSSSHRRIVAERGVRLDVVVPDKVELARVEIVPAPSSSSGMAVRSGSRRSLGQEKKAADDRQQQQQQQEEEDDDDEESRERQNAHRNDGDHRSPPPALAVQSAYEMIEQLKREKAILKELLKEAQVPIRDALQYLRSNATSAAIARRVMQQQQQQRRRERDMGMEEETPLSWASSRHFQ